MRHTALLTAILATALSTFASAEAPGDAAVRRAVALERVQLTDGFWADRLETARTVTVPHVLDKLEESGHVANFDKAAGRFDGPLVGHRAFDSDLHKGLEAAVYALQTRDDPELRRRVESMLDRVLAAQQDDGFLISWYIVNADEPRWDDMRLRHQLYNAGHFFEFAVAHHRLTGEARALAAARRFADLIDREFGPNKRYDVGGHQGIKLALVKLYEATGERRYLDLARFFLDERGHAHGTARKPFDPTTVVAPTKPEGELTAEQRLALRHAIYRMRNGRMQDHRPVVEQREAVGHAVRAGYMYAAMADLARLAGAEAYAGALDHLWRDVVSRKMYLTGGIGTAQYHDEGFGDPYLLPNATAYCESCAAIAHVLWQHRMALLTGEAKYADVMELALYNGVLSGIALQGDAFFYQNPLASKKGAQRRTWIGLACCPTNLARIIPQVGGLMYVQKDRRLDVNLYAASKSEIDIAGVACPIEQETDYPWDGRVTLRLAPQRPVEFDLCLRLPGWAVGRPAPSDLYRFASDAAVTPSLKVNGEAVVATPAADGYVHLDREWRKGDTVELTLPMPPRRVRAHANVEAARGKVALMRGPVVYCLEAVDHADADLFALALPVDSKLAAEHRGDLLGGVTVLTAEAQAPDGQAVPITAIPYYAWANREKGAMTVWVREPAP